jgi:hypothetical protein
LEHTQEQKALKQENLKILDKGAVAEADGAALTSFTEVANSGHNDVLVAASEIYSQISRASAPTPV